MNRLLPLLISLCAVPVAAATAQDQIRRADAHEHSVAAAQLAVEAGRIDLMLQVPGANLVGFEHPPRNGEQRATLDEARSRLAAGAWLVLPEAAGCSSDFELKMPGFEVDGAASNGAQEQGDDHEHDHEHEHDNEDDHEHNHDEHDHEEHEHDGHAHEQDDHENGSQHAEFQVTAMAECDRPEALEWVEIRLFEGWPDNRSLRVDAISATAQWRAELTADQARIALQ